MWSSAPTTSAENASYTSSSPDFLFQKVQSETTSKVYSKTTSQKAEITSRHVGVNYLTLYYFYDTSTNILERDFSMFKKDGIDTIAIAMCWYRLESSKGVYNQEFINNVIRVSNIASKYGLQVMINFHTLIGQRDSWSNPQYVDVAMNLITNPDIARAYVAMVKWAVTQLKALQNVWAYSVLNEPWYWPLDEWRKTNWINLIVDLSKTVKLVTNKPITVRFVADLFERDWGWDSKLLGALDFISLNTYASQSATNDIYWNDFDELKAGLTSISQTAAAQGKQIVITEFGYETSDDTLQSDKYRAYTDIFKSTLNVIGWLSWGWDCEHDKNNPTWTACAQYSIVRQATGTPRPAYSVLIKNK